MSTKSWSILQIYFFNRKLPAFLSSAILIFVTLLTAGALYWVYSESDFGGGISLPNGTLSPTNLTYGSWPALENADFFNKTRERFIEDEVSFLEADLSAMTIRYYEKGELVKESPILSKGREGSWWETPAGLYQISTKEINHFSSFGQVNMPYSMQFQGNFFVHGPTTYPDGTPTASSYSGGCIRVDLENMEEIYNLVEKGTPLLVFENSFSEDASDVDYANRLAISDDVTYLAADLENNFVFAANAPDEERSIASITKLLTALVAVEYINVEKEVYITEPMLIETSIDRLKVGEEVAVLDLLSLLLQESSNEAAVAIPTPIGERRFVNLMNTKAEAIGMTNSHFVDTSGVLSGNKSTAEDLFNLAKYLYHNRSFVLHMTMGEENRIAYGPARYPYLQNFNEIDGFQGQVGGKTGKSSSAGDSIMAVYDLTIGGEERPIVVIILGSDYAKRDASILLEYIQTNYALE